MNHNCVRIEFQADIFLSLGIFECFGFFKGYRNRKRFQKETPQVRRMPSTRLRRRDESPEKQHLFRDEQLLVGRIGNFHDRYSSNIPTDSGDTSNSHLAILDSDGRLSRISQSRFRKRRVGVDTVLRERASNQRSPISL